MNSFDRLRQAIALLMSVALVWTSGNLAPAIGETAEAFTPPSNLPQFQLQPPAQLGRLADYFNGDAGAPLVVLIQDLHAHYGAQKNIARLLDFLSAKRPFALAVEGASGPVDNSVLALYPDKKVRAAATDYLLREAEITGADLFAIERGLPQAVNGVENPHFYQINRDLFRQSFDGRTQLVQTLDGITQDLTRLPHTLFSSELKAFVMDQSAYRDGEKTPEAWISQLMAHPQARGLNTKKNFPSLTRFMAGAQALSAQDLRTKTSQFLTQVAPQLSAQEKVNLRVLAKAESTLPYYRYLRELVTQKQLYLSVPLDLAQYLEYLHTLQTSEMDHVLFEAQTLAYQIELHMAQGQARDLVRVRHDVDLLRRITDLQAMELEVRQFAPRLPEFLALARTLLVSVKGQESSVKSNDDSLPSTLYSPQSLRRNISAAIDYYVMAMARNQPMVDNTCNYSHRRSGAPAHGRTPLRKFRPRALPPPRPYRPSQFWSPEVSTPRP